MCIGAGPDATSDAMAPLLKRKNSGGLDAHDLQCARSKQLRLGIQELLGSNSRGEIDMSRRIAPAHTALRCLPHSAHPLASELLSQFFKWSAPPPIDMLPRAGSTIIRLIICGVGSFIVVDPDTGQDWSRVRMITSGSTAGVDLPPGQIICRPTVSSRG